MFLCVKNISSSNVSAPLCKGSIKETFNDTISGLLHETRVLRLGQASLIHGTFFRTHNCFICANLIGFTAQKPLMGIFFGTPCTLHCLYYILKGFSVFILAWFFCNRPLQGMTPTECPLSACLLDCLPACCLPTGLLACLT